MAQTYRDVAIDQMIATVEEAMSHAIDWWGNLPTPLNQAIDKFRVQLGAAIDSVEFVKRGTRQDSTRNFMEGHRTAVRIVARAIVNGVTLKSRDPKIKML